MTAKISSTAMSSSGVRPVSSDWRGSLLFLRTMQDAIWYLLIKERLDLPPQLRELDDAVENVELSLRRLVDASLHGNAAALPPHVLDKVDARILRATKKNAALDAERFMTLTGKLEYFDLRELQDTITSKTFWSQFEDHFLNKETLVTKLDQLSELRNAIRHSRTVDQITAKEGEAAVLWFGQVLGKTVKRVELEVMV